MSENPSTERNRVDILGQIKNPLVFFGLALLIIEGIFGLVVVQSKLDACLQFWALVIMAILFLCVVGVVAFFTHSKPENLYETIQELKKKQEDALKRQEEIDAILQSTALHDKMITTVKDLVKPDALKGEQRDARAD